MSVKWVKPRNRKKIEKYIKNIPFKLKLAVGGWLNSINYKSKIKQFLLYTINVLVTGCLIYYSLTKFNPISLGITILIIGLILVGIGGGFRAFGLNIGMTP